MQSVSLKEFASGTINTFLNSIGFVLENEASNTLLRDGVLHFVNELSDYYEEGTKLFPEIIILDSINYFNTIPIKKKFKLYSGEINYQQFCKALKMCAPFATNGWLIYVCINQTMEWGVITSELSETSIPLGIQIIHDRPQNDCHVVYLRNTGQKNVLLQSLGGDAGCQITMSLNDPIQNGANNIDSFCNQLIEMLGNDIGEEFDTYIRKIVNRALRLGHGNLFVIIEDGQRIPEILKGGISLEESPIELYDAYMEIQNVEDTASIVQANYKLQMLSNLSIGMMNQDGITIFTKSAKIVGFHYIVENNTPQENALLGGARTKAYEALCNCQEIGTVFMRKQEGETKLFVR